MKFIEAECPNCGAQLQLDNKLEKAFCSHCGSQIVVDDALKSGDISYMSVEQKIKNGKVLLKLMEFDKAYKVFDELTTIAPDRYEGWLGLFNAESMNELVFDFEYAEDLSNAIKCIDDIYLRAKIQNIYDRYIQKSTSEDEKLFKRKIEDNNKTIAELKNRERDKRRELGDLKKVKVNLVQVNQKMKYINVIGISLTLICAISIFEYPWLTIILFLLVIFTVIVWRNTTLKIKELTQQMDEVSKVEKIEKEIDKLTKLNKIYEKQLETYKLQKRC